MEMKQQAAKKEVTRDSFQKAATTKPQAEKPAPQGFIGNDAFREGFPVPVRVS